ncbi:hypothetical protein STCU_04030 [Strigomonas culicis]|nr:hypothetical protein STCU_04030 [Strigomonas culicis]|eukprot:EPY30511.1 hypothetical protein STCU_04030 [Strigomonas culicis]
MVFPTRDLRGTAAHVSSTTLVPSATTMTAVVRPLRRFGRAVRFVLRLLLLSLGTVLYAKYMRSRLPRAVSISKSLNCSSSPDGPCVVMDNILTVSNSHAGTHADMPFHFSRNSCLIPLDNTHYNGSCVVLDLSVAIRKAEMVTNDRGITASVMEEALAPLDAYIEGRPDFTVWRLLVVTRRVHYTADDVWDAHYAFFYPEAIEYINRRFPHLLLLATDAASMDGEKAAPICDHSHGALLRYGIAILENVDGRPLYGLLEGDTPAPVGVVVGSLLTVMSRTEIYPDSKGCSVLFFPEQTSS